MGLFSKKDYVCEKCGATYAKMLNFGGNLCKACAKTEAEERNKLMDAVGGYDCYHYDQTIKHYTSEELHEIAEHKNAIVAKYKNSDWITKAKLGNVGDNYKQLTETEIDEVLRKIGASRVNRTIGAAFGQGFFVPTKYDGVIVDAEDVFAVAFTTDSKTMYEGRKEGILCAVFTNDPYIPVFPMEFVGQRGMFELTKSKSGREGVVARFEFMCPNLTYPICDMKQMKKLLKEEGEIKGNLSQKFMLEQLQDLSLNSGLFNMKNETEEISEKSRRMIGNMGYIENEEINELLKMDKMFNRKFWEQQIARYNMSE